MITDLQYLTFMQKLAADQRGKNPLMLPDFDRGFLASWLQSSRPALWFTPRRNMVIDRMWMRFGAELNFPHPLDRVTERPAMAEADADGCEYIVKDEDRRQQPCNQPATSREPGKLRYCERHVQAVRKACPKIALVKFTS